LKVVRDRMGDDFHSLEINEQPKKQ